MRITGKRKKGKRQRPGKRQKPGKKKLETMDIMLLLNVTGFAKTVPNGTRIEIQFIA